MVRFHLSRPIIYFGVNFVDKEEIQTFAKLSGKRIGGTIENWEICDYPTKGNSVCRGHVIDDSFWDNGEKITTSKINYVCPDKSFILTKNTCYFLGNPSTIVSND